MKVLYTNKKLPNELTKRRAPSLRVWLSAFLGVLRSTSLGPLIFLEFALLKSFPYLTPNKSLNFFNPTEARFVKNWYMCIVQIISNSQAYVPFCLDVFTPSH